MTDESGMKTVMKYVVNLHGFTIIYIFQVVLECSFGDIFTLLLFLTSQNNSEMITSRGNPLSRSVAQIHIHCSRKQAV